MKARALMLFSSIIFLITMFYSLIELNALKDPSKKIRMNVIFLLFIIAMILLFIALISALILRYI